MDKACEGDETRELVAALGATPVVPPKRNRKPPWSHDEEVYKPRNEVERLFRRLKADIHPLRQAGRHLQFIHLLGAHCRCVAVASTRSKLWAHAQASHWRIGC